ncbi:MAG: hypothetical protein H7X95_10570 [Deltaproteobacteria bacterium]|nr:hypothetical protein [Deltaproteobacteria bacterium]
MTKPKDPTLPTEPILPTPSAEPTKGSAEKVEAREAELISFPSGNARGARATDHLTANRSLIVRRSLLATAVGGVVPIPVMDDYLAGRVRAGMLMQIADRRKVDLLPSAAELLADPREGTAARNATMTAATLLALKLAWRKFFILLGAGRRAEEMATTFQVGTLFDHFCAKTHVGAGLDRAAAVRVRTAVFAAIRDSERAAVVGIFQEGGRVLGRSIGEAPGWASKQLQKAVEQYVASGGNPDAVPTDLPRPSKAGVHSDFSSDEHATDATMGAGGVDPDARWLDRAAGLIEDRLGRLGNGYIESLLTRFDQHLAREPVREPEALPK